jgi:predicted PurR-regulated permease PerM
MTLPTIDPPASMHPDLPPEGDSTRSPLWGSTLKLIVGLTVAGLLVALVIYFRNIIGPLMLAFVLTYLLHPVAKWLRNATRFSWSVSVNIVFLVLLILLVGTLTASSLALIDQIQNLINFISNFAQTLPELAADLSGRTFRFWLFEFDLSQFDLTALSARLLELVQPVLTRLGGLVGTFATGAASTFGWLLFILVISYFLLSRASSFGNELLHINVPGYNADIRRLGRELARVWNAFLRGQLIMFVLMVFCYWLLLTVLGVRFALGIAFLAGLARFVPYFGPLIVWIVLGLVSFFQTSNYYGLEPWQFTLLAIGLGIVLDQIFDNIVSPRFLGDTLGLHPAAVLIAAILAANLIGIIGLIMAAPVLATLTVLGRYGVRKMLDLDPWPMTEEEERLARRRPTPRSVRKMQAWYNSLRRRYMDRRQANN